MTKIKEWVRDIKLGFLIFLGAGAGGLVGALFAGIVGELVAYFIGDRSVIDTFWVIGFFVGFWRYLTPAARVMLESMDEG